MTIRAILEAVYAIVQAQAAAMGWSAEIADDPRHALELLLSGAPGAGNITIYWDSDTSQAEHHTDTRCEGTVRVALMRAKGLGVAGRNVGGLVDAVDKVRAALVQEPIEGVLDGACTYAGMGVISTDSGAVQHGYVLRFSVLYGFSLDYHNSGEEPEGA